MGKPPGQWQRQPRVNVRERFRDMSRERLGPPEALRQRLAVIQRNREIKIPKGETQRIPGRETQWAER